jgi:hypothetical protein
MKYQLIILFVIHCQLLSAQKNTVYTVQPGENVKEVIPLAEQYHYSDFQKGIVYFGNGRKSSAMLNYYLLTRELSFINTGNDTVVISNPGEVKKVEIGADVFYYAPGCFVKKDTVIGDKVLAATSFLTLLDAKRKGAYGIETDGGVDSYGSFFNSATGAKIDLTPQTVVRITKIKVLFISDRFLNFTPVNRKNIFSLYPEKSNQLSAYLKLHEVDFFNRNDIIELIRFMNTQ